MFKEENASTVYITASSGVAACHGFYHYLKYHCNCQVAWEGSQINLPDTFPPVDVHIKSPSQFIYFQNVCTWSYSYAWWTFDQWRRHIDWMALHGITLTLGESLVKLRFRCCSMNLLFQHHFKKTSGLTCTSVLEYIEKKSMITLLDLHFWRGKEW